MKARAIWAMAAMLMVLGVEQLAAQQPEVKYFEEGGKTIKETRHVTQQPVMQMRTEQRESTYYRTTYSTELQEVDRTFQVPITEYHWEPTLENRWNPFSQPYWTYKLVPRTRWEARVEKVKVPVTKPQIVPEKITHHVSVPTHEIQTQEVITRVAVQPQTAGTHVAANPGGHGPPSYSPDGYGKQINTGLPKQDPNWSATDETLRK